MEFEQLTPGLQQFLRGHSWRFPFVVVNTSTGEEHLMRTKRAAVALGKKLILKGGKIEILEVKR